MIWRNAKSFSFTQLSICLHAPAKPGIYLLHTSIRCVHIAETDNIRRSLLGHLRGDIPWITIWDPTGFSFELWPDGLQTERKNQLISHLQPVVQDGDHVVPDLSVDDAPNPMTIRLARR